MKCQSQFSWKIKQIITNLSSADLAHRVVTVNKIYNVVLNCILACILKSLWRVLNR